MTADTIQMLTALDDLEKLSLSYAFELSYLSKRIRMDIWEPDKNSKQLAVCLDTINKVFRTMNDIIGDDVFFSLDTIIEYIKHLSKYSAIYSFRSVNPNYFNELVNDLQLKSAERIIEQQWRDVHFAEDGFKCFISIFDDIFTNAINIHKNKFFYTLIFAQQLNNFLQAISLSVKLGREK